MPARVDFKVAVKRKLQAALNQSTGLERIKVLGLCIKFLAVEAALPETGAGSGFSDDDDDTPEEGDDNGGEQSK